MTDDDQISRTQEISTVMHLYLKDRIIKNEFRLIFTKAEQIFLRESIFTQLGEYITS